MERFLSDVLLLPFDRVAVIGHQATQLSMEVLLNGRTWHEAMQDDWRMTGAWRPGWEYVLRRDGRSRAA